MVEIKHIYCFPDEAIPLRFSFFPSIILVLPMNKKEFSLAFGTLFTIPFKDRPPLPPPQIFVPKLYGFKAQKLKAHT